MTISGGGAVTFAEANFYSGGTTIYNDGSALIGDTNSLSGNIVNNSTNGLTFNQSTNGTYAGILSGSGPLIINPLNGEGVVTLAGKNTYSGGTKVYGGGLSINSLNNLGTGSLTLQNGATLQTTETLTLPQTIILNGAGAAGSGGTFNVSSRTTTTLSGNIGGSGAFAFSGPGTLFLTGNNNIIGEVTINSGTLTGTATSIPIGNMTNNGSLVFNQATDATFEGLMSGRGTLTKEGTGNLTLSQENRYSGGTILNEGTLSISSVYNIGNGPLAISNAATLELTGPLTFFSDITLNGAGGTLEVNSGPSQQNGSIEGTGALVLSGSGNFTLMGSGTYSGGTTINPGSTLIGTTSTFPAPISQVANSGNIIDNGTLIFNQVLSFLPSPTFAGDISGSGSVIVEEGSVDFTGTNTSFSGIWQAGTNGTITGNTDSLTGDIVDNGVVIFDQATSGTYLGNISGTGSLIKEGVGQLTLVGVSPLTGSTTVREGALSVQGGLPNSHVVVEKIAALKGTGEIGSADIKGRIMPGNSIGAIQILNDLIMEPSSIYEAEVSVNGADSILVGRNAQLAGILDLRLFETKRPQLKNKSFTLLTAGTRRQGIFTHTSTDRIKYTVQYLPQSVQVLIGNMQDFTDAFPPGDHSNAEKTAAYFDTFADNRDLSPDLTNVINGLDTLLATGDSAAVQNSFNQIQPSQYKELGQLSFLQNELVNRTVGSQQQNLRESLWVEKELEAYAGCAAISPQRAASFHHLAKSAKGFKSSSILKTQYHPQRRLGMLALPGAERVGMPANSWIKLGRSSVWVQSYGQIERTKGNHGNAGIRSETGGISLGGDHEVLKNTYLGFLGGMSTTPFHWQQGRGSGRVKSYYGGVYGTWLSQTGFYADGQIIAGGDNYSSHRNIVYPGVNRKARQSHNGGQFSTDLQAGYVWSLKHLTVQPYADATYMFVNESGFREKGAQSLDFKIKGRMSQFFRGELGAQVYKTYVLCDALIRPALQLSWVHKRSMGPNSAKVQGGLVGQSQSLVVSGDNRTRNQVAPGLALTVQFAKGLYIIGNVSSQFGGGQKLGDALIRVGYDF